MAPKLSTTQSSSGSNKPIQTTSQSPFPSAFSALFKAYTQNTSSRLKFIDAFLVFLMASGILQFVYCILVTNFPFNAFLAGFASTVGQFVLTASLRQQVNPENKLEFKEVSHERAFADFVFGSIILHFFVYNFLG
ncbi:DAD/Ost2 [Lentinula detonsa]|uniref:Dolichyl-diphosphooligosaccharide--protein glycosyltransferase subunit OST2 n=1 Tax=Lentinula detonsa TaxID=2804962 RepID=A0A9W8TWI6_9AGAR|nr:DAD/Ost2 [Lentinula detonsa]KAJ3990378.1 DAD/Ost2 [Lentinula detonsa]